MRKEKFRHGDLVQIADDLGPSMEHFAKGCRAIVIGSYRDQYGGGAENPPQYTVFVEGLGKTSWYYEPQLTFISHSPELLDTWEDQLEAWRRDHESITWIREHWKEVRENPQPCSISAIFQAVDFHSAFERNGEYYCLYQDWYSALPFLDMLFTVPDLEGLRRLQKPDAPAELVADMERIWKALHERAPKPST